MDIRDIEKVIDEAHKESSIFIVDKFQASTVFHKIRITDKASGSD